nr:hypothetical protein [Streptomyces salinarius]
MKSAELPRLRITQAKRAEGTAVALLLLPIGSLFSVVYLRLLRTEV